VRVTCREAFAFCQWLSSRTGLKFTLPTEAQWEWACRAGSATPFTYGTGDADFSKFANLSDLKIREFVTDPYTLSNALPNPNKYDDWIPKDERFDDGALVSAGVGSYQPNAWGLHDMHGNVAEWTRTEYRPYPYREDDGRNAAPVEPETRNLKPETRVVVRGGSWYDRPYRVTSAFRLGYAPYQPVFNVGFRVICEQK
jgi:formylglycine-generating enzyme required for sulfatase activity